MGHRKGLIVEGGQGLGSPRIPEDWTSSGALDLSERKYQALVEATNTGYMILDSEGRVLEANQEFLRLTGRPAFAEILGRRVVAWTTASDRSRAEEALRACLAQGRVRDLELDYANPEGGVTSIEINAMAVMTSEGLRVLALCKDISVRRSVERSLRELENLFTLFMEHSPVYVFFKDAELRTLRLSRNFEQMLGRPMDQLLGKTMDELFPPRMTGGSSRKTLW
jgi:PAS domain S-box-containing protein